MYRVISKKMQFELGFTEDFRPLAMYIGLYPEGGFPEGGEPLELPSPLEVDRVISIN